MIYFPFNYKFRRRGDGIISHTNSIRIRFFDLNVRYG